MSFPQRDTLDIATDHRARPELAALVGLAPVQGFAPARAAAETDDLDRLQSCLDWLNHERMLLALETTAREAPRHLPRAAQLEPVPGISALEMLPPVTSPAQRQEKLPFVLSPPLACDRLSPPRPGRSRRPGTMLAVLIAAAVAGAIAYHATAGTFPLPGLAQAAPIQTP